MPENVYCKYVFTLKRQFRAGSVLCTGQKKAFTKASGNPGESVVYLVGQKTWLDSGPPGLQLTLFKVSQGVEEKLKRTLQYLSTCRVLKTVNSNF